MRGEVWGPRRGLDVRSPLGSRTRARVRKRGGEKQRDVGRISSLPRKVCVSFGCAGSPGCRPRGRNERNGLPFRRLGASARGALAAGRPASGWEYGGAGRAGASAPT